MLVTGKGGAGKTTVAASLATLAAVRGRSVLLCEVDMVRSSLAAVFGVVPGMEPRSVGRGLHLANVRWPEALHRFLVRLVPSRRLVSRILENPGVQRFLDFTPGSRELVFLSCIAELAEGFELVVVDLPASGHAVSLLDITRSALGLFRSGPVRKRAAELRGLIVSRDTGTVLVALPEEMVVNETVETAARMRGVGLLPAAPLVVLNQATPASLTDAERAAMDRLASFGESPVGLFETGDPRSSLLHIAGRPEGLPRSGRSGLIPARVGEFPRTFLGAGVVGPGDGSTTARVGGTASEFLRAGRWEDGLEQATEQARRRLEAELEAEVVLVPPGPPGAPAAELVREVSVALGRHLGVTRRELTWP